MASEYIYVDLDKEEKEVVLKYASFFVADEITKSDLLNKRKKWIQFKQYALSDVIGELSYHFNRCEDDYLFQLLDQLIGHLENYEKQA